MITIIHGDDITKSRTFFIEQKGRFPETQILDGEKISVTDLAQILDGGDLFGSENGLFIEQLLSKKRAGKEKDALISFLLTKHTHAIFLWEGKELDKRGLTKFAKQTLRAFSLPKSLFLFLDSLKPGNGNTLIKLFHETLLTSDVEMVLVMLIRQVRILLALSSPAPQQIDEVKRLAPWQMGKLQKQAKLFSQEKLLELHAQLFQIDHDLKTGNLATDLGTTIDFLLLEL